MKYYQYLITLVVLFGLTQCIKSAGETNNDELFQGFENPPSEARPFVRSGRNF